MCKSFCPILETHPSYPFFGIFLDCLAISIPICNVEIVLCAVLLQNGCLRWLFINCVYSEHGLSWNNQFLQKTNWWGCFLPFSLVSWDVSSSTTVYHFPEQLGTFQNTECSQLPFYFLKIHAVEKSIGKRIGNGGFCGKGGDFREWSFVP